MSKEDGKREFARRIQRLLLERGWNQSELARRAGLPRDSISTYVRGVSFPTPINAKKVADALGVEVDSLIPNYIEEAIDTDHSNLEMRAISGRTDEAWLRVDRRVTMATAMKVIELLNSDSLLAKGPQQA